MYFNTMENINKTLHPLQNTKSVGAVLLAHFFIIMELGHDHKSSKFNSLTHLFSHFFPCLLRIIFSCLFVLMQSTLFLPLKLP